MTAVVSVATCIVNQSGPQKVQLLPVKTCEFTVSAPGVYAHSTNYCMQACCKATCPLTMANCACQVVQPQCASASHCHRLHSGDSWLRACPLLCNNTCCKSDLVNCVSQGELLYLHHCNSCDCGPCITCLDGKRCCSLQCYVCVLLWAVCHLFYVSYEQSRRNLQMQAGLSSPAL